jgi:hypothetical protein
MIGEVGEVGSLAKSALNTFSGIEVPMVVDSEERWLMTVVVGHEANTFTLLFLGPPHFPLTVV